MVSKEFFAALDEFETARKIKKEVFLEALELALTSAYKKHYGEAKNAIVKLDSEKHTIKIYSSKTVVENVEDADKEISLEDAKLIKASYKLGDVIEKEETPKNFGRIAAQTAKQVVMQKLRDAEKEIALSEIAEKIDTLTTGVIKKIDGGNVFIEIGSTEALMGEKDQIPGEKYHINDRIKVYVKPIPEEFKGSLVQVSRSHVNFVKKLFELEVPEIENGEIVINSISREAGSRTKLAVSSNNPNLDVIGACVGNRGMRINSIVDELNGEKIDIVEYSEDMAVFVERALSPAKVNSVEMITNGQARAVVPDDVLSLAIGRQGQNVKLAARLTHCKIDVKPESEIAKIKVQPKNDEFVFDENISLDDMFKDEE